MAGDHYRRMGRSRICLIAFALAVASLFTTAADAGESRQTEDLRRTAALTQPMGAPPALLSKVQREVMDVARYVPDPPGHSVWRASTEGDCKDLALEMARRLQAAGVPHGAMRILVTWKPSYRQWHAALLIRIDGGAWLLDSLLRSPVPWDGKGVEFQVGPQGRRVVAINGIAVTPTPWRR
jgi:predicted transglutaminase-like cysteine proteinase